VQTSDVRAIAPGKLGTLVYATEGKAIKQYDPSSMQSRDVAMTARVPDTISMQYPPRKQYIYFISGDDLVQVSASSR